MHLSGREMRYWEQSITGVIYQGTGYTGGYLLNRAGFWLQEQQGSLGFGSVTDVAPTARERIIWPHPIR